MKYSKINNFRDFFNFYLSEQGEQSINIIFGIPIKQTSSNNKYCKICAKKIHQEQKNKWKREKWNRGRKAK